MEKIDFFSDKYFRESPRSDRRFGILDGIQQGKNDTMAYTTSENEEDWNAVVTNKSGYAITFMPLDHNIVLRPTPNTIYSLSDGMLYDSNREFLAFVELKVRMDKWLQKAISQLESAITLFAKNHHVSEYRNRVAYAANKTHPHFHFSQKETMQKFRNDTKFRLLIQNDIDISL